MQTQPDLCPENKSRFSFKPKPETFALCCIVAIGAVLRFYRYATFSFTNDELSAITRTHFKNFTELIAYGVKIDGHPAGVEVFLYYWMKLTGLSEMAVRFPFVLCGIFSIGFAYLLGAKWFNKSVGLFVAAAVSFLQFPLLYSQLARPYCAGMLFILISVWCWTWLLFGPGTKRTKFAIGYALSTSLVTYIHHYAFFIALLVGITGLFFLNKENFKSYGYAVLAVFILYLPHLSIFLFQFGVGGVGGWLEKPGPDWIWKFIFYAFNSSWLVLCAVILIFVGSFILKKKGSYTKFQLFALVWFMLSYLLGYFYSLYRSSILQYSILIFSFPFLLLFIFSFIKEEFSGLNKCLLSLLSGLMLYSTVVEQKYFSKPHLTEFRALAADAIQWEKQYGAANISKTINIHDPYYLNYYFNKFKHPVSFLQYKCVAPEELARFRKILDTCSTKYFMYGWSSIENSSFIENSIRRRYNIVAARDTFLNSGIALYQLGEPRPYFSADNGFEKAKQWRADSLGRSTAIKHSGNYAYRYEKTAEFGPSFSLNLADLKYLKNVTLQASVWIYALEPAANATLVVTIDSKDQPLQWQGEELKKFSKGASTWTRLFINVPLTAGQIQKGKADVYVWNMDKQAFYIDDFEIKIVPN